jgi:hypothetical protein
VLRIVRAEALHADDGVPRKRSILMLEGWVGASSDEAGPPRGSPRHKLTVSPATTWFTSAKL